MRYKLARVLLALFALCALTSASLAQRGRPTPIPDSDGDGINDAADACPFEFGLPSLNGCPDTDGDGFANNVDQCPREPGRNQGCPTPPSGGSSPGQPADASPGGSGQPNQQPQAPAETAPEPTRAPSFRPPPAPARGCVVTPATDTQVNLRRAPSTRAEVGERLSVGEQRPAHFKTADAARVLWYAVMGRAGLLFASGQAVAAQGPDCPDLPDLSLDGLPDPLEGQGLDVRGFGDYERRSVVDGEGRNCLLLAPTNIARPVLNLCVDEEEGFDLGLLSGMDFSFDEDEAAQDGKRLIRYALNPLAGRLGDGSVVPDPSQLAPEDLLQGVEIDLSLLGDEAEDPLGGLVLDTQSGKAKCFPGDSECKKKALAELVAQVAPFLFYLLNASQAIKFGYVLPPPPPPQVPPTPTPGPQVVDNPNACLLGSTDASGLAYAQPFQPQSFPLVYSESPFQGLILQFINLFALSDVRLSADVPDAIVSYMRLAAFLNKGSVISPVAEAETDAESLSLDLSVGFYPLLVVNVELDYQPYAVGVDKTPENTLIIRCQQIIK